MQDRQEQGSAFGSSRRRSRSELPNAERDTAEEPLEAALEPDECDTPAVVNADDQQAPADAPGAAESDEASFDDPSTTPAAVIPSQPRGRQLVKKGQRIQLSPEQRLLLLDTWLRSGLPAKDFAALVGVSKHTLYAWKKRFRDHGPEGLLDAPPRKITGSSMPDVTKRAVLMMKSDHPEWGCQRISDMLMRGPALPASPSAIAALLKESGYESVDRPVPRNKPKVKRFERDRQNQMWQTDLFSFMLKRQNRRVYVVAFLDDHSRFVVGLGIYASQSAALVMEVLRSSLENYGVPEEILTDNGSQYVTWRGKSQFSKELTKQGIKQIVARPKHPQTLGKVERFWGTLWRECLQSAVFADLEDARTRVRHFVDYYNFQRPHQGIGGSVPADRYFEASEGVLATLQERVAENALQLARGEVPREPFYMTGRSGEQNFSVHTEGQRLIVNREGQPRQELSLGEPIEGVPAETAEPLCPDGSPQGPQREEDLPDRTAAAPGTSPLDEGLARMAEEFGAGGQEANDREDVSRDDAPLQQTPVAQELDPTGGDA